MAQTLSHTCLAEFSNYAELCTFEYAWSNVHCRTHAAHHTHTPACPDSLTQCNCITGFNAVRVDEKAVRLEEKAGCTLQRGAENQCSTSRIACIVVISLDCRKKLEIFRISSYNGRQHDITYVHSTFLLCPPIRAKACAAIQRKSGKVRVCIKVLMIIYLHN